MIGEPITNALALTCGALVDAYAGRMESARERAGAALGLLFAGEWMLYTTWPLAALGFAELSAGAPAAADERLRPLADLTTMMPFGHAILGIFLPDEIEAAVALGDLDRAAAYLEWMEERNRASPGSVGGGDDRTLPGDPGRRAGGPGRGARPGRAGDGGARAAADALRACADAAGQGLIHRRRREKRLADEALRGALEAFEALDAPLWTERARAELGRVGLRPEGADELTETERRVAELAAGGLTNREVGEAAFLSPKTVEKVLWRVYRKLGIGSRAELGARMAASVAGDASRARHPASIGDASRGLIGAIPPFVGALAAGDDRPAWSAA